jgi:hypothetical protein
MHHSDPFEQLAPIKRLEPPPFLFTLIEARLVRIGHERAPRSWVVAAATMAVLLVVLNVTVLRGWTAGQDPAHGTAAHVLQSMGLEPANQLYQ